MPWSVRLTFRRPSLSWRASPEQPPSPPPSTTISTSESRSVKGEKAGENFIAVTDPGTPLDASARERRFRRVFLNFSDIGGRYSALSYFGLLPAALMGLDVGQLLDEALRMVRLCGPTVPVEENPGVLLGAVLGEMARAGRDKPTFLLSRDMAVFGLWLEQLIAESTGKEGTGLLPVAGEPAGPPIVYGSDRLFVHIGLKGHGDEDLEEAVRMLQTADLPVVFIEAASKAAIAQEFFRWEIATATAGALLGINPFDQPNVQESKDATNRLLSSVGQRGSLTEPAPVATHGPLSFFSKNGVGQPRGAALGLPFTGPPRGLRQPPGLSAVRRVHGRAPGGDPAASERRADARRDGGVRAALPPLHGADAQGRSEHGSFHSVDLPRRDRPLHPAAAVHLRHLQEGPGHGRSRGARETRPEGDAHRPRQRREEGPVPCCGGLWNRPW